MGSDYLHLIYLKHDDTIQSWETISILRSPNTQNNNYNTQYWTNYTILPILNSITQYWYIQETISFSTILTILQRTIFNTSTDNWTWWQTNSNKTFYWLLQQFNITIYVYHNLTTIHSTDHWNIEQVQYSFMGSEYLHFFIQKYSCNYWSPHYMAAPGKTTWRQHAWTTICFQTGYTLICTMSCSPREAATF